MIAQQQIVLLAVLERTFAFMLFCLVIRLFRFGIDRHCTTIRRASGSLGAKLVMVFRR